LIPSIYGTVVGVKFDDGRVDEFDASQLNRVESQAPVFDTKSNELLHDFAEYNELPANTLEEVEKKEKIARGLNLRAKALVTDSSISLSERINLDAVVTATSVDAMDLKESHKLLLESENKDYLDSRPKFALDSEFGGWGSRARTKTNEDISWVNELEVESMGEEWYPRLPGLANNAVANLTVEELDNPFFMEQVRGFATTSIPQEYHEAFETLVHIASDLKRKELANNMNTQEEEKVESFEDIQDEALYL